jgi:hypothetical protein
MPLDVDKGIELPQLELISTKNDDCTTVYSTGKWGAMALSISGPYYKHVTIVNDNSSIINKQSLKLIDDARVVNYNHNRFMIQATGCAA